MDSVFRLSNGDRVSYLLNLMHSFGCSYICLWTYSPNMNLLYCEEGHFQEEGSSAQVRVASSSSRTSLTYKLFEDYKQSLFSVANNQSIVPGLAFSNRNPYLELHELDLQRLASSDVQRRFYAEARIKMAVFLGCSRGEIELGMSYISQNLEMKMRNIFPQELGVLQTSQPMENPRLIIEQNQPSSSSSQSMDSPEYPHLFYTFPSNIATTALQEQQINEPPRTTLKQSATNTQTTTLMSTGLPTPDTTDAALTRAYLAILSSTNGAQQSSVSPYVDNQVSHRRPSAFKSYTYGSNLGGSSIRRPNMTRQNLFKRAIVYYRELSYRRVQEHASAPGSRPTSTQLHHMISERRRREKINESFQALRSLLPQGTKKDKASVLRATKEYLSSLKTQLSNLNTKNQVLEEQLKIKKKTPITQLHASSKERLQVQIIPVHESTSRARSVDVIVRLRRCSLVEDLIMKLLEFVKQIKEVKFVSMEAQASQEVLNDDDHNSMDVVIIRLKIDEGNDWDESAFKEAVTRILADLS
ncbi:hypothetical protein RND81_06G185900 [Saponaria officinalis]|uniref:BHLH domain-containing protein n=1 Tax=Saponaria officinalis TaxID=3572 RepID=A0AAW1KCB6_SAPOF